MKLLLDTHTFLWLDNEPEKLSSQMRTTFQDRTNSILLSVVSIWEMQIKHQLGKLRLDLPISEMVESQQRVNDIEVINITFAHVLRLDELPVYHRDPFDRLLIAQANSEDAILVSKDPKFSRYSVNVLW